jgi:hypothetical protein
MITAQDTVILNHDKLKSWTGAVFFFTFPSQNAKAMPAKIEPKQYNQNYYQVLVNAAVTTATIRCAIGKTYLRHPKGYVLFEHDLRIRTRNRGDDGNA